MIHTLGQSDPLIKDALTTVIERGDFITLLPDDTKEQGSGSSSKVISTSGFRTQIENDPTIVADLMKRSQSSIEELKQTIQTKSGAEVLDFILEDIQQLKKILRAFPNPQK